MATEAQFVAVFAALVAIGAVVLLFVPLVRRAWDSAVGPVGYTALAAGMLAACVFAVALVSLAATDPAFATPLVVVVIGLRLSSPALLYVRLRSRLEAEPWWDPARAGAAVLFAGLAAALVARAAGLLPAASHLVVGLSDQVLMAAGAAALFLRLGVRARPDSAQGGLAVWLAGLLFGIAFLVVAPYAFPDFAIWYLVSGVAGWLLGVAAAVFLG
jgi:hypothetical protein